jgi:uncharacterized membrane protein
MPDVTGDAPTTNGMTTNGMTTNGMTMSGMPSATVYHRWLGWHAPALRRAMIVAAIGLIIALLLLRFVPWELAVLAGWDAAALTFLITVWPMIIRATGPHVERLATREDETRGSATVLLLGASVASLLGVGFALGLAGRENGTARILYIGLAVLTVVLSWTVVNTIYTLRYAHLDYGAPPEGISFGGTPAHGQPNYRDFAYVAFTIGMTYQVSDTDIRNPRIRRTVLAHALLSYVFGVVIVAGAINLIAGLLS